MSNQNPEVEGADTSLGLDELFQGSAHENAVRAMERSKQRETHYDEDWEHLTEQEVREAQSACGTTIGSTRQTLPGDY